MSYPRLFWTYFKLGILNELQYRTNFVVRLFQSILSLGSALAGLGVVFAVTEDLAGWRADELLALVGVYFMVRGAVSTVVQPSMQRLMEDVRKGTLDFALTKPVDAQFLVSIRQFDIWGLVDFGLGVTVLAMAMTRLGTGVSVGAAAGFVLALPAGGAIVYSFLLVLAALSFWYEQRSQRLSVA